MVGLDDRGPGDDEDVPAGLERGRHHPERLAESPPDPVADHGAAELAPGRQPETRRLEVGPQEPDGEERVGPGRPRIPRSPRSPAGERASRAAAGLGRAPSSGRQPLSTARASGGQDTSTRRSSSSGRGSRAPWRDGASSADRSASWGWSGILSIRPRGRCRSSTPRGTQTRPAPESAGRVVVRRMIRPARKECQSRGPARRATAGAELGRRCDSGRAASARRPRPACTDTPGGYCTDRLATARWPVLSSPALGAGTPAGGPGIPRSGTRERVSTGRRGHSRFARLPPAVALDPWSALPIHRPHTTTGRIERWTRSRSGARHSESCRSRSPRRTTKRGCATPSSWTSRTTASGSPSRTASPRTGSRPATGR